MLSMQTAGQAHGWGWGWGGLDEVSQWVQLWSPQPNVDKTHSGFILTAGLQYLGHPRHEDYYASVIVISVNTVAQFYICL